MCMSPLWVCLWCGCVPVWVCPCVHVPIVGVSLVWVCPCLCPHCGCACGCGPYDVVGGYPYHVLVIEENENHVCYMIRKSEEGGASGEAT